MVESVLISTLTDTSLPAAGQLYLHIGLASGVLLRSRLDTITGALTDPRSRMIGDKKPVALFHCGLAKGHENAILVLTSRPWISYNYEGKVKLVPISYENMEHGCEFSSSQCPQGIIATSGKFLKIITIDKIDKVYNQGIVPLRYTPRRIAANLAASNFVIIESDQGILCEAEKKKLVVWSCLSRLQCRAMNFPLSNLEI